MFAQILEPTGSLFLDWIVALIPVVVLLVLLAVFRITAWLAVLIGSIVTFLLALVVWRMPLEDGILAYVYGSATGIWNVNWITFWGVMLFNTLMLTGVFENFRRWLLAQGTADIRVQTILFAWAFGALLEGLVGFGYPWAFVAPILISLGIPDIDAIRVAAIANNAPVSYGALGAPIIALAAVTAGTLGMQPNDLLLPFSSSVGHIVAILALLPPWILLYLVSGNEGMWEAWPLAIVGSLGYIAGQLPVAIYLGPYLPDVVGAIVCFAVLLLLLKVWRPRTVRGYARRRQPRPLPSQSLSGMAALHRVDRRRGAVDRALVAIAEIRAVQARRVRGIVDRARQDRGGCFQLGTRCRGHRDSGVLDHRRPAVAGERSAARRDLEKDLASNVGRMPRRRFHLRPCLRVQLFRHGQLARQGVLHDWPVVHCRCTHPRMDWGRAVGKQYLDQCHVRCVPGLGRQAARLSVAAAADDELGRRRDRQAGRAPDGERWRVNHQVCA